MRIVRDSPTELVLRGRRTDGEEGETGLWLVGLVGAALMGAGFLCAGTIDDAGALWMGRGFIGIGGAVLVFGLHRLARRESLTLEVPTRSLRHRTRLWPGPWRTALAAAFDDTRRVEVERRVEGASGPHERGALPTVVWRVRLVLGGRRRIELTRTKTDAVARRLAATVASALAIAVDDEVAQGDQGP